MDSELVGGDSDPNWKLFLHMGVSLSFVMLITYVNYAANLKGLDNSKVNNYYISSTRSLISNNDSINDQKKLKQFYITLLHNAAENRMFRIDLS